MADLLHRRNRDRCCCAVNIRFDLLVAAIAAVALVGVACRREPTEPRTPAGAWVQGATSAPAAADGAALYRLHCVVCHMTDGSGVPNLQPPLPGSPYLAGDPLPLLQLLLGGSAWLGERAGPWANLMPAYPFFNDDELAAVATYTRAAFGDPSAPPVTREQAAAARRAMTP